MIQYRTFIVTYKSTLLYYWLLNFIISIMILFLAYSMHFNDKYKALFSITKLCAIISLTYRCFVLAEFSSELLASNDLSSVIMSLTEYQCHRVPNKWYMIFLSFINQNPFMFFSVILCFFTYFFLMINNISWCHGYFCILLIMKIKIQMYVFYKSLCWENIKELNFYTRYVFSV